MKQYFVKGIEDEPLEYGDVVGVDLVKESDDKTKTITRHVEVPFTSDTLDMLLDLEVIEEKEAEENEPSVEDVVKGLSNEDEETGVDESIEKLNDAIEDITDILSKHQALIKMLKDEVDTLKKKKEPIDIFNQGNSCIIKGSFRPIDTLLSVCL